MILDYWKNIFGIAPNNTILFGNNLNDQVGSYGNKFLTKVQSESDIKTTEYEFDTEGYPLKSTNFYDNIITSEFNYIYK